MAGAVGRVQIERHVRVVVGHQLRDGASFWRVELHVIAIEVEPLRVGALALAAHRAVLRAAVVEREALVAVGVVDRRDQEDHRLQPVVVPARGEVAQQHLRAFLALHFAAVDVALDVDAQLAGAATACGDAPGAPITASGMARCSLVVPIVVRCTRSDALSIASRKAMTSAYLLVSR